jgi:hypothetical protein
MVPSGGAMEKKSPVTPPGIDPGTVRLALKDVVGQIVVLTDTSQPGRQSSRLAP